MKFSHSIVRVCLVCFAGLLMLVLSSCSQTTQLNQPHVNPLDSTHYRVATMTIHGIFATMHRRSVDSSISGIARHIIDSNYRSHLETVNIVTAMPSMFVKDTLVISRDTAFDWNNASQLIRIVLDSTRTRFLSVYWSDSWFRNDPIFDWWSVKHDDAIDDVPFTESPDGSLAAHLPRYLRLNCSTDSLTYSDSDGLRDVSTSLISADSTTPDGYIDIRVAP